MKNSLKPFDYIVVFAFFVGSIFLFSHTFIEPESVVIITPNKNFVFSLRENRIVEITGKVGKMVVEIKNGKVRVLKSSCPNKICIKTGWISKPGEMIICVPNEVIVKIKGKEGDRDVDYITD